MNHAQQGAADPAGGQAQSLGIPLERGEQRSHCRNSVWALTGLAQHAHGDNPSPETLRAVANAEGVEPVAAVRALRW